MAYSTQQAESDGTLVLLDISIDYISRSEIDVLFDGTATELWSWVGTNEKRIAFSPAVPAGVVVTVKRTSDYSRVRHLYTGGAAWLAQTIDENFQQLLHVVQEASEGSLGTDFYKNIDMHGYRVVNMAPGIDPSDAVTLGQIDLLQDGELRRELDGDNGAELVSMRLPIEGAEKFSLFAIIDKNAPLTPQRIRSGAGGSALTDDTDTILKMFEYAVGDEHRTLTFPRTGYGYRTETDLIWTRGDTVFDLDDSIFNKQTTKSSTLVIKGASSGAGEIANVEVIGRRPIVLDGNAWNMTGYDYLTQHPLGDQFYSTLLVMWVKNFTARNIIAWNGLVNSIRTFQVRGGLFEQCKGFWARWDNGISVDFDPQDYNPLDPRTWSRVTLRDVEAAFCTGFGLTSFGATGTRILGNSITYMNGNNDPSINPGPGGGFSFELNGVLDRDYQGIADGLVALNNLGRGGFVSATGTKIIGRGSISGTRIPTAYTTAPERYGSGLAMFGCTGVRVEVPISTSERYGIYGLAVNSRPLGLEVYGSVAGNAERGVQLQGVSEFRLDADVRFNGLKVGSTQVDAVNVDNAGAAFNQGAGRVRVSGSFQGNGGSAVRAQWVKEVRYTDILGRDNNRNHAAQSAIFADNCESVTVQNVEHFGTAVTVAVNVGAGVTRSVVEGVSGEATLALVSNAATQKRTSNNSGERIIPSDAQFPLSCPQVSELTIRVTVSIAAARVINLQAAASVGDHVLVARLPGTGTNTLTVTDGTLSYNVAAGVAADFVRNSAGWEVQRTGGVP